MGGALNDISGALQVRMIDRLRARKDWKFFGVLPKADRPLAIAWWFVLVLRGVLPALFAIAMGVLVGAVQRAVGHLGDGYTCNTRADTHQGVIESDSRWEEH